MAFMAEPGMQLQALPGGRAPVFAGTGVPATQVCGSTSFDFTVSFAPDKKFKLGSTKVRSRTQLAYRKSVAADFQQSALTTKYRHQRPCCCHVF
jgi:hypothetical protein